MLVRPNYLECIWIEPNLIISPKTAKIHGKIKTKNEQLLMAMLGWEKVCAYVEKRHVKTLSRLPRRNGQ